ncbi:MAG: OmpH family outer membrane protein [Candidatus Binatia bacterium]
MRRIFGYVLISLLLGYPLGAGAQEIKLGYVDLQKALNESEAGKKAKDAFRAELERMEGRLESRKKEVQRLGEELEKKAAVLREEERASLESDYRQKLRDFERLYKDSQQELKIKDRDLTGRIIEELRLIILDLGEQGNYTVILEGNNTVVLYGSKSIDLTDAVIRTYNQRGSKVSFKSAAAN